MPQLTITVSTAAVDKIRPVFQTSGFADAETWVKSLVKRECGDFYARQASADATASVRATIDTAIAAVDADFST